MVAEINGVRPRTMKSMFSQPRNISVALDLVFAGALSQHGHLVPHSAHVNIVTMALG